MKRALKLGADIQDTWNTFDSAFSNILQLN